MASDYTVILSDPLSVNSLLHWKSFNKTEGGSLLARALLGGGKTGFETPEAEEELKFVTDTS